MLSWKVAQGVADGSVTLAFRRWGRQGVVPGSTLTTGAGVVRVDAVSVVDPAAITDEEAVRAGYPDADQVRDRLCRVTSNPTYRIELAWDGPDPRIALREADRLTAEDLAELGTRMARLDRAAGHGPWTSEVLRAVERRPHTRAADLAHEMGRERDRFKRDVGKLKKLGLTVSLPVGYELSPRGRAYLRHLDRG